MTIRISPSNVPRPITLDRIAQGDAFLAVETQRLYIRLGSMTGYSCKCARLTPSCGEYTLEGNLKVHAVNLNIDWELA